MLSKRKNLKPVLIAIIGGIVSCDAVAKLQPMPFQKTMQDVAQEDKNTIKSIGHEPFKDSRAYTQILIKEAEEFYQQAVAQKNYDKEHLPHEMYCYLYPGAEPDCPPIEEQATPTPIPAPADGTLVGYDEFNNPVYASKTIHNGPCTLPRKDMTKPANIRYTNELINSGNWAKTDPAFEKAASGTLRIEGGLVTFSVAQGGQTKFGITKENNPDVDIPNLTSWDAQDLMYKNYYVNAGINKLPDYVRGTVFDMYYMQPKMAMRLLCRRLGISYQAKVNNEMVTLAEQYDGNLVNDLLDDYLNFFEVGADTPDEEKLLPGYRHRVNFLRSNGCHYPTESDYALDPRQRKEQN